MLFLCVRSSVVLVVFVYFCRPTDRQIQGLHLGVAHGTDSPGSIRLLSLNNIGSKAAAA